MSFGVGGAVASGVIFSLAALGVVWLYRFAAPLRYRRLPKRLSTTASRRDFDLLGSLARHSNVEVFEKNHIDLLLNGDAIFDAMIDSIECASDQVQFLTYVFWRGRTAQRFADALSAAAQRGVEVRVLIDGVGGARTPQRILDSMKDAGCSVAIFNPISLFSLHRANFRTHRKVLVVDQSTGFTGGVGIADEWTGNARDPSEWRENHFRVLGPVVDYLQSAFEENWRYATGEVVVHRVTEGAVPDHAGTAKVAPLLGRPGLGVSKIALANWFAINRAQQRLWIQTPYFVPSEDLLSTLEDAATRGLDVRLMVPGPHLDSVACAYAARLYFPRLLKSGVRILRYQRTMLHVKSLIVDQDFALIGSSNLDHRSFELNYEMLLAVESPELTAALAESFAEDALESTELTLEETKRTTILDRALMHFFGVFRYHL